MILDEVAEERLWQDARWGEQNHHPFGYLAIIGEEYGEACEAALQATMEKDKGEKTEADLRKELVQLAACAVAAVECLDRGKWKTDAF